MEPNPELLVHRLPRRNVEVFNSPNTSNTVLAGTHFDTLHPVRSVECIFRVLAIWYRSVGRIS